MTMEAKIVDFATLPLGAKFKRGTHGTVEFTKTGHNKGIYQVRDNGLVKSGISTFDYGEKVSVAEPSSPEPSEDYTDDAIDFFKGLSNDRTHSEYFLRLADLLRIEAAWKRGGGK